MSPSQPLPPKEQGLFKKIVKAYELKQYRIGLKFAKQILGNPKFAEHGETLAMKGLTLNCLGRKEEAYEHVRRGLRNDLRSHVCWHVYGLLQRSDHVYDEAIKCYRNALKWDKDNIQILRDLSLLQIQMRDLEGYRDTRYHLFTLRPTQRASWIGYAMAYHLLDEDEMAARILEEFRKSNAQAGGGHKRPIPYDYEQSELILYQVMVLAEAKKPQEALDHLVSFESEICDRLAYNEYRAQLLLELGQFKEAQKVIKKHLIGRNPENAKYYSMLEQALKIDTEDEEKRYKLYLEYQQSHPRAQAPRRLPLDFIENLDRFKTVVDQHLRRALHKGQPALFRDLKSIYTTQLQAAQVVRRGMPIKDSELPPKIKLIQDILISYVRNLEAYSNFESPVSNGPSSENPGKDDDDIEPPSTILWVYYYLAQHYDYLCNYEDALRWINIALSHTPTLIELYMTKGKIYKHAGNINQAVLCMDEAQSLDTADRYLNSKAAKYLLKANRIKDSEDMCAKFTREGVPAGDNLNEMQCMWFELESAAARVRLGQYGEALKKCIEVDRHFIEINEDQFDFHTYCMRKMTLRAYVGLLRLENVLKSHRFYFTAAKNAIHIYIHLHDYPLGEESKDDTIDTKNMSAAELKKLRSKQRKAEIKRKEAELAEAKQKEKERNQKDQDKERDATDALNLEKLFPEKLERPEDPLAEAIKFLKPLQTLLQNSIDTHLMAFEIYYRKKKLLLMLQSLKRTHRLLLENHSCQLDSKSFVKATFNRQLVQFKHSYDTQEQTLADPIKDVVNTEFPHLLDGFDASLSARRLNDEFLAANKDSFDQRVESTRLLTTILEDSSPSIKELLLNCDLTCLTGVSIEKCETVLRAMRLGQFGKYPWSESEIDSFRAACQVLFPLSAHFKLSSDANSLSVQDGLANEIASKLDHLTIENVNCVGENCIQAGAT